MKPKHILVIQQFVTNPTLVDLHSYSGYRGDVVLRLRSSSEQFLLSVYSFCEQHNIEVTHKFNNNLGTNEIFIIAEDDVYTLKDRK